MLVPDRIERTIVLTAPPSEVWSALTEPSRITQWFGTSAELDLRPGGEAVFGWGDTDIMAARIEVVEPERRFAFRWRSGPSDPALPFDAAPTTLVEFHLEPFDGGTRLTLVESGFAGLPESTGRVAFDENSGGWTEELNDFAAYLDAHVRS